MQRLGSCEGKLQRLRWMTVSTTSTMAKTTTKRRRVLPRTDFLFFSSRMHTSKITEREDDDLSWQWWPQLGFFVRGFPCLPLVYVWVRKQNFDSQRNDNAAMRVEHLFFLSSIASTLFLSLCWLSRRAKNMGDGV